MAPECSRVSVLLLLSCCMHFRSLMSSLASGPSSLMLIFNLGKTIIIYSTNSLGRDTQGCDKREREGDTSSTIGTRSVLRWGKAHGIPKSLPNSSSPQLPILIPDNPFARDLLGRGWGELDRQTDHQPSHEAREHPKVRAEGWSAARAQTPGATTRGAALQRL